MLDKINSEAAAQLYLDLMKKCLTRYIFPDTHLPINSRPSIRVHPITWAIYPVISTVLKRLNLQLCKPLQSEQAARAEGRDWPADADTMIGLKRLDNIQYCVTDVIRGGVPGDLIETGVWRGGASIFMRAVLKAYGDQSRVIWVADSFEGLPRPDGRYPQDSGDTHWKHKRTLGISLDKVKANFSRYGLLDEQVRFLVGWFKDTLPVAPIDRLAVLRLDGDMYSSTMDALKNLYHRVSVGGYVIVDDYGAVPACKQAVDDFRCEQNIPDGLHEIDWTGVFWKRSR